MKGSEAQASTSALSGTGNNITRCSLENCTVNNSQVKRCRLTDCVLSNVQNARRTRSKTSQLLDVTLAERSDIRESTVQSGSSVHRSLLKQSVVQDKSSLERSTSIRARVSHSKIQRTSLEDCDVADCVISRSDFRGMILKYGVWKKGVLIGRTGDQEPIQIMKNAGSSAEVSNSSWIPP